MCRGCVILALTAMWLAGGCAVYKFAEAGPLDNEADTIQQELEDRIRSEYDAGDGAERWGRYKANEYQDEADLRRAARRPGDELERAAAGERLREGGPLTLGRCLVMAIQFNDAVQARRAEMKAVGGEELVVRSRFLPHLDYILQHEMVETDGGARRRETDNIFRLSQTLFEFGRDNPDDVLLRQEQRDALFAYEDAVRDELSAVRRVFHTIVLRQEQVATRQELLAEFKTDYERIRQREDARLVPNVNVLTARLNVLNELLRINALEKELLRRKIELLRLLGLPIGLVDMTVTGDVEEFDLQLDQAVRIALRRSSSVAQARAAVWEQARLARQIWWDNAPDLRMRGGWRDRKHFAGTEMSREDGTYGVRALAEKRFDPLADPDEEVDEFMLPDDDESGWFLGLNLEVPILDGLEQRGKMIRENARLERVRHELSGAVDIVEQNVRQSYQTVLEQRQQLEYQRQTVEISKQRFQTIEELRTIGRSTDNELETFRNRFFDDQDEYFRQQISLIEAQEQLRAEMRFFEPLNRQGEPEEDAP